MPAAVPPGTAGDIAPTPPGDPVEALLAACLEEPAGDVAGAVERVAERHPDLAAELRKRFEALVGMGLVGGGSLTIPERLDDLRIKRRLGGGGMGVVYVAEQESLGRDVAVKVIRPEILYFPNARERFLREARAVAGLDHPGIVPVHSVGVAGDLPYFTMELVRGCTLAAIVSDLAARRRERPAGPDFAAAIEARCGVRAIPDAFEGPAWRVAAKLVLAVAGALEHAHGRGILHRDVKPSNVMVTPDGRALLLDFGLARREGASPLTQTGAEIGSLPYLPPERFVAPGRPFDRRGDVYALGVTLYELLTLSNPFLAPTEIETRRRVTAGDFPRPRALDRSIPRDLETVCLVALAHSPERRYQTAADLARDLEGVLDHRPIAARRPGPLLVARRWTQRHPVASVSLVLGCVVVVGGLALYAWQQARAAASLAEALSVSEGRRAQAQANLRAARHAVDRLLTRVSEEVLFEQPHMLPVRRALLEDAIDVYAGLARGAPEDPDLRREAARAQVRIARIAPMLGRSADAVEALAAAISAYDALGDPDQGTRLEIAAAHAQRAALLRATGRVQEATAAFSEALRIGSALVDGPGRDDPAVLAFAVTTRFELVLLRLGQDRPDDVRAEIAVAEGLIARWESTSGPSWASKQALANVLRAKGMLAGREGDREAATAHFRRASALWDELVREKPDSVQGRIGAAEALTMLGRYLGETQGPAAAMPTLERAEASWADLEASFRDWLRIRVGHSTNLRALAEAQFHAGSPEARSAFERVVARQREIVVGYPDDLNAPEDLAKALRGLAALEARSGRVEEAETALREAIALWRALSQRQPERPDLLANLGLDLAAVGSMLAQASDGAAVAALEEAVVRQRAALAAASGAPVHQSWLVHHYRLVIDLHLQDGRTGDAVRLARAILEDPLTTPEGPLLAANVFARCAGIAREAADSRPDEGRSDAGLWVREGLDSLERAIELGFADVLELQRAPGLARLRDEPRFQELVERARTGRRRH